MPLYFLAYDRDGMVRRHPFQAENRAQAVAYWRGFSARCGVSRVRLFTRGNRQIAGPPHVRLVERSEQKRFSL